MIGVSKMSSDQVVDVTDKNKTNTDQADAVRKCIKSIYSQIHRPIPSKEVDIINSTPPS